MILILELPFEPPERQGKIIQKFERYRGRTMGHSRGQRNKVWLHTMSDYFLLILGVFFSNNKVEEEPPMPEYRASRTKKRGHDPLFSALELHLLSGNV